MADYKTSPTSKVKRGPNRATYDPDEINAIIDSHFIAHVPYDHQGTTITIPTGYGRHGNTIFLHGAIKNRMLASLLDQKQVSLTITHMDGLVLARSVFHHSFNYRSAVVFGTPRLVEDADEKNLALKCITENIIKGRWDEARQPNEKELKITKVLAVDITEASGKIRSGGPVDDDEDYDLDIWAGELPINLITTEAITDENMRMTKPVPESVKNYKI